ncbi:MAG: hypothetical protein CfP315_0920 [Candidatus Improbicoccus pseudotrichonymphae]|uniref:Uncharacterized protein n=1 Tax=Candidatus Improbicoccus pseudotrichonymphae TaxID=3033792 RepID=A0AA48IB85_9FIRM|nr:MAG: hypothetical protein CfP315_0920 [Candidatus Improbicoccus pseudotrichonymphae]
MKKENSIDDNKNSKKISKNNKIISSILAVIMCCRSLVGAVDPPLAVDGSEFVEPVGKDLKNDNNNLESSSEDENNYKDGEDENSEDENINNSKSFSILAKICIEAGSVIFAVLLGGTAFFLGNTVKICGRRYLISKVGNECEDLLFWYDSYTVFPKKNFALEVFLISKKISFLRRNLNLYSRRYLKKLDVKPDELERLSKYSKFIVSIANCNKNQDFKVLKEYFNNKGIETINLENIKSHVINLLSEDSNFCLIDGLKIQLEIKNDENNSKNFTVSLPAPLELAGKIRLDDIWEGGGPLEASVSSLCQKLKECPDDVWKKNLA